MTLVHIENNDLKQVNSAPLAVIDFYADWCGPCQMIKPIFEALEKEGEFKEFTFMKVDVDANDEIAMKFAVTSIPTIVVLKNGQEIARRNGFMTKDAFKNFLKTSV